MPETTLKANAIEKTYANGIQALKPFSMEYSKGMVAVLGANGAGKTTLLSLLAGILQPSSGCVQLTGENAKIGWTGQNVVIDWFMNTYDNVLLGARLSGLRGQKAKELTDKALKSVGLWDNRHGQPETLSGGQQQRVQIARLFASQPGVMFLDEPTTGLDIEAAEELMSRLSIKVQDGVMAFVSSHDLGLLEKHCSDVLLIKDGIVIFFGSAENFIDRVGSKRIVEVETENKIAQQTLTHILPKLRILSAEDCTFSISMDHDIAISSILEPLAETTRIMKVTEKEITLVDAYRRLS